MTVKRSASPIARIADPIYRVRGHRVMLDADLAGIYGVSTMRLNEQVKRNRKRFPEDFAFRLTREEWKRLISQSAMAKLGPRDRRTRPCAFTEHGAVMVAAILGTPTAVQASVCVVQAFQATSIPDLPRRQADRFILHPPIWAKPAPPLHRPREPRLLYSP